MQEQQASKHPQIKGVVFEDSRAVLISAVGRAKKSAKEGQGYRHGGQAGVAGHSLERGPLRRAVKGDSPGPPGTRDAHSNQLSVSNFSTASLVGRLGQYRDAP